MILLSHLIIASDGLEDSSIPNGYVLVWDDTISNGLEKSKFMFSSVSHCKLSYFKCKERIDLEEIIYSSCKSTNSFIKSMDRNSLTLITNQIEKSREFWNILGFNNSLTNNHELTSVNNLNMIEFKLFLVEDKSFVHSYLDNCGLACISFISTNLQHHYELLNDKYFTSKIESVIVNKRQINYFFIKGPSNELVEIFSIES
jgi:hypothetical protein